MEPDRPRRAATSKATPAAVRASEEVSIAKSDRRPGRDHAHRDRGGQERVPEPEGHAVGEPRVERLRIDPAHLLGVPIDQLVVPLDQSDHPPEPEPAEIGVSRIDRRLDPVELGSEPPGGTSPSFHGCLQVRRYDAPDALRPALERFPREESTIARSITQPAPPHGGGHAFVTLDGRYHMVERIAAGGMGEVFRAHDAVLAREVAIKVLHRSLAGDPAFVDRFRREAAPPPASPTRTSSPSTTGARSTASTTWSWSTCAARASGTS